MARLSESGILPRQLAEDWYCNQQMEHRYDGHIAPINKIVDDLCNEAKKITVPYVAPIYGGVNARLLSILRDPGPKANQSKFLSIENDDPTAERMYWLIDEIGINVDHMVPWNAYPWYINREPKSAELGAGVEPLRSVIDLMPKLRVVILHGGTARKSWKKLTASYKNSICERKLEIIETYHPSPQAFRHKR